MKRIVILGSTGSIGRQTLDVVKAYPERFEVVGLAAGSRIDLLKKQVEEFGARSVFAPDLPAKAPELASRYCPSLEEMAALPEADLVVIATAGNPGLEAAFAAIRSGKSIALANKEILVMAGEILVREAKMRGVRILPLDDGISPVWLSIDSEHCGTWQCLRGERKEEIRRLILTASGGPFRTSSPEELERATPEQALRHPTWRMGPKATLDSATLMHKGFEVIEAHWLFDLPYEKIEAVIHPQSIIHSLVEFIDGSLKAQLSFRDMRVPILHILSWPERWENKITPPLDLVQASPLTFEPLDERKFPCFKLALEAGRLGGTFPAVLCGADEVAVNAFLEGKISFPKIAEVVEDALQAHSGISNPSLEEIREAERWGRARAEERVRRISGKA